MGRGTTERLFLDLEETKDSYKVLAGTTYGRLHKPQI